MSIVKLPPEIMTRILQHLVPKDLARCSQVSKFLCDVVNIDGLWELKIKEEFGFDTDVYKHGELSAKTFYAKILSKYGSCLGFWRKQQYKGYIMEIRCEKGEILGYQINPPKTLTDPIEKQLLFIIRFTLGSLESESSCIFRGKLAEEHEVELKMGKSEIDKNEVLLMRIMRCASPGLHCRSLMNGKTVTFQRLHLPRNDSILTQINPGIFRGSFRQEGIELVKIEYDETECTIYGTKVTGDQYVPSGEMTFRCDLRSPVHPTPSQLQRMSSLRLVKICQDLNCLCPRNFPNQPFHIPFDCIVDVPGYPYADTALGWYLAEHQIAYPKFTNPEWIPAHLAILSNSVFVLFCFQLNERTVMNNLSIFERIELSKINCK